MELSFNHPYNPHVIRHQCTSTRRGEWITFRCPHCPEFERHVNYVSGELEESPCHDTRVRHEGFHKPEMLLLMDPTQLN